MKQNFKGHIALAALAILILAALLASGCDSFTGLFSEEETERSWVDDLPPLETGSHRVYFLTSHISPSPGNATLLYQDVRPPETTVGALADPPGRSGYTFIGWYDNSNDEGGTLFTAGTVVTRDWKLYARWIYGTPTTVIFDGKNGTPPSQTKTVTPPDKTVLDWPQDPTPPGAEPFSGWYTETTGGVMFTRDTAVPYSTTITVYAQYGDKYTVTFDKNGGETGANPAAISVFGSGTTLTALPVEPALTGKLFGGWFDTPESTGGTEFTTATPIIGNITVYARWNTPPPSTVTFDLQGGSGSFLTTREVAYNQPIGTLPVPTTPRANLSFAGWYTQANSGGVKYTESTKVTENVTLRARWKGLVLWYKFTLDSQSAILDESGGFPYAGNAWTSHNGTLMQGSSVHTGNSNPGTGTTKAINGKNIPVMNTGSSGASPHMDMGSSVGADIIQHLDEEFTIAVFISSESGAQRTAVSFLKNGRDLTAGTSSGGLYILNSTTAEAQGYGITATTFSNVQKAPVPSPQTTRQELFHIAFTQTGKTGSKNGKLYFKGALVFEGDFTLLPSDIGATLYNTLGRPYDNSSNYYGNPAFMGDFRIYNRALSAEEIANLANAADY
jgi:uncharacterized repeat protein (TIGR02543 family)